jgi:hypothetical protein
VPKSSVSCPLFKHLDDFLTVTAELFNALPSQLREPDSAEIFMRMALMKNSLKRFVPADGREIRREFELNDAGHETIFRACESRWEMMHSRTHTISFVCAVSEVVRNMKMCIYLD